VRTWAVRTQRETWVHDQAHFSDVAYWITTLNLITGTRIEIPINHCALQHSNYLTQKIKIKLTPRQNTGWMTHLGSSAGCDCWRSIGCSRKARGPEGTTANWRHFPCPRFRWRKIRRIFFPALQHKIYLFYQVGEQILEKPCQMKVFSVCLHFLASNKKLLLPS
jgi:hypothetical protein